MSFLPTRGWYPRTHYNILEAQAIAYLRRSADHPEIQVVLTAILQIAAAMANELKLDKEGKDEPEWSVEKRIKNVLKPIANHSDASEYESTHESALKEITALCVDDTTECSFCDNEDLLTGQHQPKCPISIARKGLRAS